MSGPLVHLLNPINGRVVEQQCSAAARLRARGYPFASDEDAAIFESWRGGQTEASPEPGPHESKVDENVEPVGATPGAVALAAAYGIDLASVEGSGAGGRILKRDVEKLR